MTSFDLVTDSLGRRFYVCFSPVDMLLVQPVVSPCMFPSRLGCSISDLSPSLSLAVGAGLPAPVLHH